MTPKDLESYLLSLPNTWLDYPFGEGVAVYKVGPKNKGKMFALVPEGKAPLSISLKCDPQLAVLLREKYETVMEGYHLNKRHWNTMLLTGQLSDARVEDLIRHSYHRVCGDAQEDTDALKVFAQ
jgi:predicted DNA-binding protein (MmcQ/YjbR family)